MLAPMPSVRGYQDTGGFAEFQFFEGLLIGWALLLLRVAVWHFTSECPNGPGFPTWVKKVSNRGFMAK